MLRLAPLADLEAGQRAAVERVYLDGFAGYAPWSEVSASLRADEDALVGLDGDRVAAFLLVRRFPSRRVYLRYFAVAAARRGQGYGSATWPLLLDWARERGADLLIWDVEARHEPGLSNEQLKLRSRRVAFYERLGGTVLAVPDYGNPDDQNPGRPWSPAELMVQPVGGTLLESVADPGWRAGVAREVYRHRYDLAADDLRMIALEPSP